MKVINVSCTIPVYFVHPASRLYMLSQQQVISPEIVSCCLSDMLGDSLQCGLSCCLSFIVH